MPLSDPANHAAVIAPSDTVTFNPCRAIYVGAAGNMTVRLWPSGEVIAFANVPVGVLPVCADRVNATALTAGSLVALW